MSEVLDEARRLITEIRAKYDGDPELGHSAEDGIAMRALSLCAEGHPDGPEYARLVLELMRDESLMRWYA